LMVPTLLLCSVDSGVWTDLDGTNTTSVQCGQWSVDTP